MRKIEDKRRTTTEGRGQGAAFDAELVGRAQSGDERALVELLETYRAFARRKARSFFLTGSDPEDVVQEAMIGLYKAIRDYKHNEETPFAAFAELCISRQIFSAIKQANRHKHTVLNTSVSVDQVFHDEEGQGSTLQDRLVAPARFDPLNAVISSEEIEGIRTSMREGLTDLEAEVLTLYIEGRSYEDIAAVLGSHMKSIDNALQRIKRKLKLQLSRRNPAV